MLRNRFLARARLGALCLAVTTAPALASFHLMQIEQVLVGVNGDPNAQVIQLRMRSPGQHFVSQGRLKVYDAAGVNPILLKDLTTDVANSSAGDRVLICSSAMASYTTPTVTADFTLTNLIPSSYFAAGSLTFEDDFGTIYWRLSWGGAAYTGSNAGNIANDSNSNFGPPFANAVSDAGIVALKFGGAASAGSTSNSADYALTTSSVSITNNARNSFTVTGPGTSCPGDLTGDNSVDLSDLSLQLSNYGNTNATPAQGDLNGDHVVDLADLAQELALYGTHC